MGECQTEAMIDVEINGEQRSVPSSLSVATLLKELGIAGDRVAVELNRTIVRQALWDATPVEAGARLEIVHFVGGG